MSDAPHPAAAMMEMVDQRRSALIAQCPVVPPLSPAAAAALPIHVTTVGTNGPTVMIVHGGVQGGLGGGPSTFASQEVLAERGWTLKLVERPGFGRSPSRGVDDMTADATWIADLLADGAHLVGHSWGGAEALLAAAQRPEAVRSLTLIEPALFPLLMTDPTLFGDATAAAAGAELGRMLFTSADPAAYAVAFARSLGGDGSGAKDRAAKLESDPDLATRFGCAMLQAKMAPAPVMRAAVDSVARAGVPTLVVSGGWSASFDLVARTAARLTGGRFEIVDAPNHFVQQVSADRFNALLDGFMRAAEQRD